MLAGDATAAWDDVDGRLHGLKPTQVDRGYRGSSYLAPVSHAAQAIAAGRQCRWR